MGLLGIILLIIFVICALLLIFMVLIQDDQGEGIGGLFGGGSSTAFGSSAGNVLTRFYNDTGGPLPYYLPGAGMDQSFRRRY